MSFQVDTDIIREVWNIQGRKILNSIIVTDRYCIGLLLDK
jgi:hypothetical protein